MDEDFVRDALLQQNYYPRHRSKTAEMPPFFTTEALDHTAAAAISSTAPTAGKSKGYDFAPYTLTRFNGGPRLCGLPHPYGYCRAVETIVQNWKEIQAAIKSDSSQITAKKHADGRIFIMDYDDQFTRSKAYLIKQSCSSFVAKADISNFYPSIYTHSIGWAAVGMETAKSNTHGSIWYNKLDSRIRDCKRQETNGVIIGPGTSSIVSEIILSKIDRILENRGYKFLRFIDDYTCFSDSRQNSENFLRDLERELSKFSLYLNFRKTSIDPNNGVELPKWIPDLLVDHLSESPSFFELKLYLSRAIALSAENPTKSYFAHRVQKTSFLIYFAMFQTGR